MLTFERPVFLFALVLPYIFFLLKKFRLIKRRVFSFVLFDYGEKIKGRNVKLPHIFFALSFIFLLLACAQPVWITYERTEGESDNEIIFVLDTSPSMQAMDEGGETRLFQAKRILKRLAEETASSGRGLVLMGSEAALACAPTVNTQYFFSVLSDAECGEYGEETAIGEALSLALYHLQSASSEKKCVVLLTDGESNAGKISVSKAVSLLRASGTPLFVITFGHAGSAPIEYTANNGKKYTGFIQSTCDYEELSSLSRSTGGELYSCEEAEELSLILKIYTEGEVKRKSRFVSEKKKADKFFTLLSLLFSCFAVGLEKLPFTLRREL